MSFNDDGAQTNTEPQQMDSVASCLFLNYAFIIIFIVKCIMRIKNTAMEHNFLRQCYKRYGEEQVRKGVYGKSLQNVAFQV